jgi:ABC-type nitrate/sulfonate/bicarbonate transport system ATPase subunit
MRTKIDVKQIAKGYTTAEGALRVVDGVSFSVGDGEFVALVGPSGCGKSTLVNVLAGFLRPDQGAVLVDGVEVTGPSASRILITQQGSVFPWLTVRENLTFGIRHLPLVDQTELAYHYASLVGLLGFEHRYPYELSGGMVRRVELARALVMKPEILFMDEPFSALDALLAMRMRNEVLRILVEERHTIVSITHDVEEAIHMADRIVVLSPRPTKVQAVFDVALPHPRKLTSPAVQELRVRILRELGVEHGGPDGA